MGIGEKIDKGRGEGGTEGREGERGQERLEGAPIYDLSNHQLKSTLMVPVGEEDNKSMRYVSCEYI